MNNKKLLSLMMFLSLSANSFAAEASFKVIPAEEGLNFDDNYFDDLAAKTEVYQEPDAELKKVIFHTLANKDVTYTPVATQASALVWSTGQILADSLVTTVVTGKPSFSLKTDRRMQQLQPVTVDYQAFLKKTSIGSSFKRDLTKAINTEMLYDELYNSETGKFEEISKKDIQEAIKNIFKEYEKEILLSKSLEATYINYIDRNNAITKLTEIIYVAIPSKLPEVKDIYKRETGKEYKAPASEDKPERSQEEIRKLIAEASLENDLERASEEVREELAQTVPGAPAARTRRKLPAIPVKKSSDK